MLRPGLQLLAHQYVDRGTDRPRVLPPQVAVVDLDIKSSAKIAQHYALDRRILQSAT